jgi:hypothetical protein
VFTRPASYAKSGFAYGWTNSARPRSDKGEVGRDASVTSVGLSVLEYIDGSGDVDRVTGDAVEAYDEPTTELGLRGGGGGTEVSWTGVCDTVLDRPREKINGREGRNEDVAEEEEDAVACDCPLDTISEIFAHKIGGDNVLTAN